MTLDQDYMKNKITVVAYINHIFDLYLNQRRPFMRTYADHIERSRIASAHSRQVGHYGQGAGLGVGSSGNYSQNLSYLGGQYSINQSQQFYGYQGYQRHRYGQGRPAKAQPAGHQQAQASPVKASEQAANAEEGQDGTTND